MYSSLKFVLKIALLSCLVLITTISSVSASDIDSIELESFMDKVIEEQMEGFNIPNATISIVSDGKVVLQKGYGYADMDKKVPVDPENTLFRIGSTSKLFTWTSVMQLVEEGKLDLDEDINNYLDFIIPNKLLKGQTEPGPITLRHLLTHTPGFEDSLDGLFYLDSDKVLPLREYLVTYMPERVFPPGKLMAYSNYGAALAGYIVERVSGMPFAEYVEQNIYKPLEMNSSSFKQPLNDKLALNLAKPYRYVNGEFIEGSFEFMPEPAGSMSTTASDMSKFMIAHLQDGYFNGERILKEKTISQMHNQAFTQNQNLGGMTLGFMEGIYNGHQTIFQGGGTMIFSTGLYLLPGENTGVFISYSGGPHLIQSEVFYQFMNKYYPESQTSEPLPPEGSKERSKQFIGDYHSNRRSFTTSSSILSLLSAVVNIDIDEDGYLVVNYLGESSRFVEKEPGVYHNLRKGRTQDYFGPFSTLVFDTDSFGKVMLFSDGPMTYSKAPWYATGKFTIFAFIISIVTIALSLIYWIIRFIIRLFKGNKSKYKKLEIAAKYTTSIFSIVTLGFLTGFGINSEMEPAFGVPKSVFGIEPSWISFVNFLPTLMAFLAIAILIFTMLAWYKGLFKKFSRIHYTVFSAASLTLVWIFSYWKFL